MLVLAPAEFGSRRPRSKIPAVIFLIVVSIVSAIGLLWWNGRDPFVSQLPARPLAYLHLNLDLLKRPAASEVASHYGLEIPSGENQLSFAAFAHADSPVWYLITDRSISDRSSQLNKIFLTPMVAGQSADFAARQKTDLHKPWIWFGQPDYGFIDATVFKNFIPSLVTISPTAYFQPAFRPDRVSFSLLPEKWHLYQVLLGGTFGTRASLVDFSQNDNALPTKEAYFGPIPSNFFDIFRFSPDQLTALAFLNTNSTWPTFENKLASTQMLLEFADNQWQARIFPAKPLVFSDIDQPSRNFLSEMWPPVIPGRFSDGSPFQEKKADPSYYQWLPRSVSSSYLLNKSIEGQDIYLSLLSRGIQLSNFEDDQMPSGPSDSPSSGPKWLSLITDCGKATPNSMKSALYSQAISFMGYQQTVFVDNGGGVDICFYKSVDK